MHLKNYAFPDPWLLVKVIYGKFRSSHSYAFLEKGVRKKCNKFTGQHPCQSVISIKSHCNFIKITLWHWCSPVNLLHIFRTPFPKNTSGWLLLKINLVKNILQQNEGIYQFCVSVI